MIEQKIRQFLVHSFLYYQVDESILEDTEYDLLVTELRELIKDQEEYIYKKIIEDSLGAEGSAFSIRKYPPEIISTAFHLLYQEKYKETKSLNDFVKTYGYGVVKG